MATHAEGGAAAMQGGRGFMADQGFFTRFVVLLVVFILFAFIQFELRGLADIRTAPLFLHVHGAVMVSWLGLVVMQNLLIQNTQLQLHRTLGWLGVALAAAVVAVCSYTGVAAIKAGTVPPFFSVPQFLALTQIGAIFFGLLVGYAILRRRQTQWHRRLMLGSLILITEPALGRTLPMPLMGGEIGEWVIMAVQLGLLAILVRHDRKMTGEIHPATSVVAATIVLSHVLISGLSNWPAFAGYAQMVAAA